MTIFHDGNRKSTDAEEVVTRLVALAQREFGEDRSEDRGKDHQAGLVRFERSVAKWTLRRRSVGLRWVFGFGLTAAAVVVSFLISRHDRPALTFSVVNGKVSTGGYVRADATGGTALKFSDGSSLALDPGTSARVGDVDANGGRVLLESGRARVHVTPRPRASWTIDAGPYSVHVIGTEFDIHWSASEEILDLHLLKGAIVVRGPLATDGMSMETGAHLFANVRKGEIRLDERSATAPAAEPAPPAEAVPAAESAPSPASPREIAYNDPALNARTSRPTVVQSPRTHSSAISSLRTPARETGWATRLARGDFKGVLTDAERRGLDSVFATAAPTDLAVLADSARFARRVDIARGALLAERGRFPGSPQSREAAFFLGGLTEDQSGESAMKAALEWYECYLRESPNGAFVRPVLGRKMVLVQRLRGTAAARPLAVEYLERFSDGPYAGTARKLVQAH